jgi:hypothetical protein
MRNIMIAACVVAGLAVGCKSENKRVQDERADVVETRQEMNKDIAEVRHEAAEDKAEVDHKASEKIADKREDLAEEQKDLAEAKQDLAQNRVDEASVGGTVTGMLKSTMGDNLTVRDVNGLDYKLETDDTTRVRHNGTAVKLDDFKEGTEVRASYSVNGDEKIATDVEILKTPAER